MQKRVWCYANGRKFAVQTSRACEWRAKVGLGMTGGLLYGVAAASEQGQGIAKGDAAEQML